jgi:hypothetical protein
MMTRYSDKRNDDDDCRQLVRDIIEMFEPKANDTLDMLEVKKRAREEMKWLGRDVRKGRISPDELKATLMALVSQVESSTGKVRSVGPS